MNCQCGGFCTARMPVFESLAPEEHRLLVGETQHLEYQKGSMIFRETDPADAIIIIRHGKIKLNRYSFEGREYILDILSANDIYGEQDIFGGTVRDANGIALEDTGICTLSRKTIHALIMKRPEIGIKLLAVTGEKLAQATEMKEILSMGDARARLASFLLFRMKRTGGATLSLTRSDISASVNLSRETISRKLCELEAEGLVVLKGHRTIRIKNADALRAIRLSGK